VRQIKDNDDNQAVIKQLSKIDRLSFLSRDELQKLIKHCQIREYQKGEILIREGEYDDWVYLLISGRLEIIKDKVIIGQLQRNGDMFGEMGIIDGSPRSATIKAIDKSLTLSFDASIIDQKLKSNDAIFCYIIYRLFSEVLASRLRKTTEENQQLRKALARFGA
jgi:CRP-like cAMP-binding protein